MSSKDYDAPITKKSSPKIDTITSLPQKLPRGGRKKRVHSSSFSHSTDFEIPDVELTDAAALSAALSRFTVGSTKSSAMKNSRKSRDGKKLPNKRGGKNLENPIEVLDEIELEHGDPDYDSDENDSIIIETIKPPPTDETLERTFACLLREFYIHGKTEEVLVSVKEMNLSPHQRRFITYTAISSALQQKKMQCELTSELLSDLCGPILTQAHIQQGFQMILYELADLIIDVPNAVEQVGRFIARALADDILPPKFIHYQQSVLSKMQASEQEAALASSPPTSAPPGGAIPIKGTATRNLSGGDHPAPVGSADTHVSSGFVSEASLTTPSQPQLGLSALMRAETLLNLSRAFARLDNIWGIPAGPRATSALVGKVSRLLSLYYDAGDIDDAREALADLASPHFHHELVYQCIIKYVELSSNLAFERAVKLLSELCHSAEITADQMQLGVRRAYAELPDLKIDVPLACPLMDRFIKAATNGGFLSRRLAADLTGTRSRKRFVSETEAFHISNLSKGLV